MKSLAADIVVRLGRSPDRPPNARVIWSAAFRTIGPVWCKRQSGMSAFSPLMLTAPSGPLRKS
jgi:hypothetical protein